MKRFVAAGWLTAVVALALGALPAFAGGGNSDAAHACQKGGYLNYTRADATPFANTGDCVSYAAHGGVLTPVIVKTTPTIRTSLFRPSISAGSTDYDTAALVGATPDAGGHVTYTVYSDSSCTVPAQWGGTVLVYNGHVPDSFVTTFPAPGTYYWQAAYTGDAKNGPAVSACSSEPLSVTPLATPTISTQLYQPTISAGSTDYDTATLSGATPDAGGHVTYTAYADSSCSVPAQSGGTVLVYNGHVPDSFITTFPAPGTYYWQASYTGDENNASAVSPCTSEPLTVTALATPTISTTLFRSTITAGSTDYDSATLTGATPDAGGTISYSVYGDSSCTLPVSPAGTWLVSGGHAPDSAGVTFPTAGTYYWQATYSGDANNVGVTSACSSEPLTVT